MSFDELRHNMVVQQLERRGIHDPRVLEAMEWVPREEFVPKPLRENAYEDCALPIGFEQTISQPYTVAFMCQAAHIAPQDNVLEIGTGSGYGAAVLSLLAREVHTVERIKELYLAAQERLERLHVQNVSVHLGDGTRGLPDQAPFNAIICTAGAETLPKTYIEQLADGGRLVIPIGPPAHQVMHRIVRRGDRWEQDKLGGFGFVPLVGGEVQ